MKTLLIAILFLMATVPLVLAPPPPIPSKKGIHHATICKAAMLSKKGGCAKACNHHCPKT